MIAAFLRNSPVSLFSAASLEAALLVHPALAQLPAQTVLTDTPAYCDLLVERISELELVLSTLPPEASRLAAEGRRMCELGLTRGGIARLRRALVMIKNPQPYPP